MEETMKIPNFSYEISSQLRKHHKYILVDGVVIHEIDDVDEFYRALGYTDEMRIAGIEPEVFRWSQYTKDDAVKSPFCLQSLIIEYLNQHSEDFRKQYGRDYASWIGTCASENLRDTDDCKACTMHPK